MKNILAILFSVFTSLFFAQSTYFVKDHITNEAIPFSKIRPDSGNPFLADIDGAFLINETVVRLEIKSSGYSDTTIYISEIMGNVIFLSPVVTNIQEVVAVAGENPAHRIINLAIENRKKNNPMENDAFRYQSYSKFIFDMNQEALDSIPDNTTDSTLIEIKKFFTEQHLFMIESASIRTFVPPARDKEEITAYKVSGFSNPMFSTFASELQSFSFYENQFLLMGKTYINPIAFGGTKRYLFIVEDTTVINRDTTFTIFYRPKKGKNFEGMTGRLYINTNGYAIEKVTAMPYEDTTGNEIQIIQEYALIDGKKWFPSKLSTELSMKGAVISPKIKNGYLQGKGSTYIKNVELNPEGIKNREFDNTSVFTNENAGTVKDEEWDSLRVYEITDKEERTYEMIDSLSKKYKFDQKLTMLTSLMEGKLPLGYVNLDLTRLLNYNLYEGYRFGGGLETSKKVMKNATIGGYYGWGTKDKEPKFGGYSTIHFYRKKGIKLNLRYQQDLLERGGNSYQKEAFSFNTSTIYRHFYIQNMERQRLGEIALSGSPRANIKLSLIANYQRVWFTGDYQYLPDNRTDIDLAETSVEIKWNIREQSMQLGEYKVSKGTRFPKFAMKATKGWKGWFESDYEYLKLQFDVQQQMVIRGAGKLSWSITAGQTFGEVPLFLMQVGSGTGKAWNLSVMNTFETMKPSEFYNDRQVSFFTRYDFKAFKTKAKWNQPQVAISHAIGYGAMTNRTDHSIEFKTMDKGFFEGGIIFNNVLVSKTSGFGIAAFYRYGTYSDPDWKKNIIPKISVSINLE